jgi:hypothetical protein
VLRESDDLYAKRGTTVLAQLVPNWHCVSRDSVNLEIESAKNSYDDIITISWNCLTEFSLKIDIVLSVSGKNCMSYV